MATGWMVRGSKPVGGEIFRTCRDRPWHPPSLLYNWYGSFPGVESGRGVTLTPHPLLVLWSTKQSSYTSTLPEGAHTRTSLASESGWARVPMSQTRPCVECHELESTLACVVKYIRALLPSQAPRSGLVSQTRTRMGTFRAFVACKKCENYL
jgi:hypothetical protein